MRVAARQMHTFDFFFFLFFFLSFLGFFDDDDDDDFLDLARFDRFFRSELSLSLELALLTSESESLVSLSLSLSYFLRFRFLCLLLSSFACTLSLLRRDSLSSLKSSGASVFSGALPMAPATIASHHRCRE